MPRFCDEVHRRGRDQRCERRPRADFPRRGAIVVLVGPVPEAPIGSRRSFRPSALWCRDDPSSLRITLYERRSKMVQA